MAHTNTPTQAYWHIHIHLHTDIHTQCCHLLMYLLCLATCFELFFVMFNASLELWLQFGPDQDNNKRATLHGHTHTSVYPVLHVDNSRGRSSSRTAHKVGFLRFEPGTCDIRPSTALSSIELLNTSREKVKEGYRWKLRKYRNPTRFSIKRRLCRIPRDSLNFPASAMRIRCGSTAVVYTYCVMWLGRCQRLQSIAEGHARLPGEMIRAWAH